MQVDDPSSFIEKIRMLTSLRSTIDHKSCEEDSGKSSHGKCIEQNSQPKHKKTNELLMNNFPKKCIELGLEQNDESSSTPSSSKYGKVTSSDVSDGDSLSVKITKSNSCSSSAGSSSSTTSASASSFVEDESEKRNASEIEEKDIKGIENDYENRVKDCFKVTSPQREPTSIKNHLLLKEVNRKHFDQYSDDCDRENNFLDSVKSCHSKTKNYLEQQNLSLPTCRNKSIKRKRENVDVHTSLESNTKDNQSKNLISSPNYSNSKSLKLDNEASLMTENIGTIHEAKIVKSTKNNPKRRINFSSSELQNNSKKSFSSPNKLQSVYSCDSHLIQYLKELPRKPINERKVQQKPKVKDKISNQSHNLLDQVAAAFAEQLSGFNLGQLASLQASQLNLGLEKQNCNLNIHRDNILPCNSQHESTPQTSPTCGTPNKLSVDTDDMLPIQAEVVMTDGSENEDIENTEEKNEIIDEESKINKLKSYLQSFISCSTKGSVVEYPPLNNEVPKDGSNLTTQQLEKVALLPFTSFVPPPQWLKVTIPVEGYKSSARGDTYPESLKMDKSTFMEVVKPLLGEDSLPVIDWMKNKSLIRRELKCESCNKCMNWTKCSASLDGYVWKCQMKDCSRYKRNVAIRKDSFFAKSKVKLQQWVHIIYCWCSEMKEQETSRVVNISRQTIVDFYNFFREVCTRHIELNPIKLGGPGITVQIDELCLSHKPKHHRGGVPKSQAWVYGLVDTSTSPVIGYMEIVDHKDQETLLPIIEKVVRHGSSIHSDDWQACRNIANNPNYQYKTLNHSLHLLDPQTGIHTQHMESYWAKHKAKIKHIGCRRNFLSGYLNQFMWMERNTVNRLSGFCNAIAMQYPFNN